jgi:hypothetical protein
MATVSDIITDALEITGMKDPNDSLESVWETIGLRRVNSILDGWNVTKLRGYSVTGHDFTLTPLEESYTVGIGGDFNIERPVKIENAYIIDASATNFPLNIVNFIDFQNIDDDSVSSLPYLLWYNPKSPLGEIKVYPAPEKNYTLHLDVYFGFAPYSGVGDTVSVPQGYERLLTYQLATELCSHRGKQIPPDVMRMYREIERTIEAVNFTMWMPSTKIMSPNTGYFTHPYSTYISRGI